MRSEPFESPESNRHVRSKPFESPESNRHVRSEPFESPESNLHVRSEPLESRGQATCVLIASMLCTESPSMDVSKRVLC